MVYSLQLLVLRVRLRQARRAAVRRLVHLLRTAWRGLPGLLRWIRSVLLVPLWLSFELYIRTWERLERRMRGRSTLQVRSWHRALFCLAVSLTAWQAGMLLVSGASLSEWTMIFSAAHGVAVCIWWKRGVRWFRAVLGVRPVRSASANPWAGLDLGN
jgi:hypothetical protein